MSYNLCGLEIKGNGIAGYRLNMNKALLITFKDG